MVKNLKAQFDALEAEHAQLLSSSKVLEEKKNSEIATIRLQHELAIKELQMQLTDARSRTLHREDGIETIKNSDEVLKKFEHLLEHFRRSFFPKDSSLKPELGKDIVDSFHLINIKFREAVKQLEHSIAINNERDATISKLRSQLSRAKASRDGRTNTDASYLKLRKTIKILENQNNVLKSQQLPNDALLIVINNQLESKLKEYSLIGEGLPKTNLIDNIQIYVNHLIDQCEALIQIRSSEEQMS